MAAIADIVDIAFDYERACPATQRTRPPATDDDATQTDIATDDPDVARSPNDITAHEDSREASG